MNPFFRGPENGFGPFQNINNLIQSFQQFRSTFQGDPKQKVEELMQSGKMSQSQFQQLSQMAQNLKSFMH